MTEPTMELTTIVGLLEAMLARAKRGELDGIGLVVTDTEGRAEVRYVLDDDDSFLGLIGGLVVLQRDLLEGEARK